MAETIYEISKRLCRTYNCRLQSGDCSECPLAEEHENMECLAATIVCLNIKNVEKQLKLMRKWAEDHPAKTYKDVFLEKLPNAMVESKNGLPNVCRKKMFGGFEGFDNCVDCIKCWSEPCKEQEDNA